MKTSWFVDNSGVIRPLYQDEDGIHSPDFNFVLVVTGDTLSCCELDCDELLVCDEYILHESLTSLANIIEGISIITEYNPQTHVAVPKGELAKLEVSRVALYEYLSEKLFFDTLGETIRIHQITQQIWNVANRIKWEK